MIGPFEGIVASGFDQCITVAVYMEHLVAVGRSESPFCLFSCSCIGAGDRDLPFVYILLSLPGSSELISEFMFAVLGNAQH